MRISSITIKNYKCHKDTNIVAASNFHTLIGANSSGKTSIIEACRLPKKFLGLSPSEYDVFTNADIFGKWQELYGYTPTRAPMENPSNVTNATVILSDTDAENSFRAFAYSFGIFGDLSHLHLWYQMRLQYFYQ
jgi:predicted ATP-binding protein involved in virulence